MDFNVVQNCGVVSVDGFCIGVKRCGRFGSIGDCNPAAETRPKVIVSDDRLQPSAGFARDSVRIQWDDEPPSRPDQGRMLPRQCDASDHFRNSHNTFCLMGRPDVDRPFAVGRGRV